LRWILLLSGGGKERKKIADFRLQNADCERQRAAGSGQQAEIRGQKTEIMLWERLSSRDITTLTIPTISTISTT
jgi:hypothetical protein